MCRCRWLKGGKDPSLLAASKAGTTSNHMIRVTCLLASPKSQSSETSHRACQMFHWRKGMIHRPAVRAYLRCRGNIAHCHRGLTTLQHIPVLAKEVVSVLQKASSSEYQPLYCDATFGEGGYTRQLLDATSKGTVIAVDQDPSAYERAVQLAASPKYKGRIIPVHGKFGDLVHHLDHLGYHGQCLDGIAFDIGVSSQQIDDPSRGFSFRNDGPLDMRMGGTGDQTNSTRHLSDSLTAEVVVNTFSEEQIADILYQYGEEGRSRRVARAIVSARSKTSLRTTGQLRDAVISALGIRSAHGSDGFKHPATRTFQALRIYVNDELGQLHRGLSAAEHLLKPARPLVCVTFHSLEDRIVKQFLQYRSAVPSAAQDLPILEFDSVEGLADTTDPTDRDIEKSYTRAKREKYLAKKRKSASGLLHQTASSSTSSPLPPNPDSLPTFQLLFKKAVTPERSEVESNRRARSAKLRAALRTEHLI
ncbi:MraW methylase family-domain-containing protein [Phlyctochytrium arcticum]|nr:MraW methylase family-domain-containing protein [Phlyctochytrium arcticum]